MKKNIAIEIICLLFILLFVYAAVNKLMDMEKFRVQLQQSPMLTAIAGWVMWIVPMLEIIIAVLLSLSRFRQVALYASYTLMVIFTSYIIAILNFSEYIPCSCGGVLSRLGWNEHLVFNIAFVMLAIAGSTLQAKQQIESKNAIIMATPPGN
ncbi:hypothetical protein KK083_29410 [Fulvivirgaceae bacterium PWU4]|uniref:Methylamine utilisation protein MauE domain-containing protein n=1 Tax=Chryseosolibacter histidini TaxID=2782349 RepID=A0AAP2GSX3_9BACT|nr:MauE/DoxX family redox-associated membrane protein [Chryseosolibacter histidini]MBT1701047.1 hypothetical protein [Chryseosolibacter histidini]